MIPNSLRLLPLLLVPLLLPGQNLKEFEKRVTEDVIGWSERLP